MPSVEPPEAQPAAASAAADAGGRSRRYAVRRETMLWGAVGAMAVAAAVWLGYETYRFFAQPKSIGGVAIHPGAIDLKIFHAVVTTWFSGKSVFVGDTAINAVYPPASMVLAWPLYGWESLRASMFVWSATAALALAWLVRIVVRETGARTPAERAFAALMPLAIYPTGAVIGNGQMTLHVLVLVIAGLLVLRERSRGWGRDALAALLITLALAKPTLAAPFFWIALFAGGGVRAAILVVVAYVAATLLATSFQAQGIVDLFRQIATTAMALGARAGESNVHALLGHLGRPEWSAPLSLALLLVLGLWVWRHRAADRWLLMGVAALVARFWTYHRWYDDLLILVPMVALGRLAFDGLARERAVVPPKVLLAATLAVMIAPGGLYLLPARWTPVWTGVQVAVWVADLVFLLVVARRVASPLVKEAPGAAGTGTR
jgi:hypothetical protein